MTIGDRVRVLPSSTVPVARTGVVVARPPPGHYGCSVKIRWDDTGDEEWLGSLQQFEVITTA
jgi:hypothetical protein